VRPPQVPDDDDDAHRPPSQSASVRQLATVHEPVDDESNGSLHTQTNPAPQSSSLVQEL
jgi:hypothetical protein